MDMKANKTRQVFGHASDPRVQVKLPVEFKASEGFLLSGMRQQLTLLVDARCAVLVDIKGKSTSVAWYEIWEAVIAVATMCVRAAGKGGKYHGLGKWSL